VAHHRKTLGIVVHAPQTMGDPVTPRRSCNAVPP
jgi:hypothetical protein